MSERYINNLTGDFSICFSEHLTEHPIYFGPPFFDTLAERWKVSSGTKFVAFITRELLSPCRVSGVTSACEQAVKKLIDIIAIADATSENKFFMSFLLFSNWFPIWFLSTSCFRLSLSQSCCAEMFRHKNVDSCGDFRFFVGLYSCSIRFPGCCRECYRCSSLPTRHRLLCLCRRRS